MNFSTLFRTKENLSLDKNTLTILRYIAIIGQILAISVVFYYLNLPFPIIESYLIIHLMKLILAQAGKLLRMQLEKHTMEKGFR